MSEIDRTEYPILSYEERSNPPSECRCCGELGHSGCYEKGYAAGTYSDQQEWLAEINDVLGEHRNKAAFIDDAVRILVSNYADAEQQIRDLEEMVRVKDLTLQKIARWHGEFPPTGEYHDDSHPKSYGYCYGSNGERDFMRHVARNAAALTPPRVRQINEARGAVIGAAKDESNTHLAIDGLPCDCWLCRRCQALARAEGGTG